ncbi:hypothetical protein FUAX_24250 [Fulvitalea axinellae]|uniref:SMODS-associating 2TM beta-strand rich effector domain-containing protein n=1 Tax=Fulvitalea axinellae TaxID=1182444 RepID=A0AAU9CPL0_9BACT|nr:hypothetical protein FUAX_24250 [Fulvitalea axinellae]
MTDFKKLLSNALDTMMIAFGFLGFLSFSAGLTSSFHVYGKFLLGVGGGLLLLAYLINKRDSYFGADFWLRRERRRLMKNGLKVEVDLAKCKLKSNDWAEIKPRYRNQNVQMGDSPELNEKSVEQVVTDIQGIFWIENKPYKLRCSVVLDEHTVISLLGEKGKAMLYIDPENHKNYFFDMGFLHKNL